MSQENNKQMSRLNFLVGKWQTSGKTISKDSTPVIPVTGTDTYEWVSNGDFLQHTVDVLMGDKKVQTIEMIGNYSETSKSFEMNSHDNKGNSETMKGSLTCDGTLLIEGEKHRATLTASEDGKSMEARWEQLVGTEWEHWMEMKFIRIE